jgi:hypothetical protein
MPITSCWCESADIIVSADGSPAGQRSDLVSGVGNRHRGHPGHATIRHYRRVSNYLATRGDFWDQERGDGPWDRKSAEEFAKAGWAPTLSVTGKRIITARRWRIVGPRPLSE